MARRTLNLRDLRAAHDAAEALGLNNIAAERKPKAEPKERRPKPELQAKMRVVWAVCDVGGRTIQSFDYSDKAAAEARAAELKAKGKGMHFVRSLKEQMS